MRKKKRITENFLNTHDSWVIDGNYSELFYERRMEEGDIIILLLFNRFSCLYRAYCRYIRYKNTTRPDMAEGCKENKGLVSQYGDKAVVIKIRNNWIFIFKV